MAGMAEAVNPVSVSRAKRQWPAEVNVLVGLIVIIAVFETLGWLLLHRSFILNPARIQIVILQVSIVGIIAVGVTQVIITGGIDLSSGSVTGATAMIAKRTQAK